MCERYVGLVRVSTDRQGVSGLGLSAGKDDIDRYIAATGAELVATLEEVESGTHDDIIDRPTLLRALSLCKRTKACLLVPKVDRLVRSTQVHADIKKSGVKFRAVDNPEANEMVLDILVAVACAEGRAIADRTRKALQAYKRERRVSKRIQGMYPDGVPADVVEATAGKLGAALLGSRLTPEARAKGLATLNARKTRDAMDAYADLIGDIQARRDSGETLQAIADKLNADGHTTRNGAAWAPVQVLRLLKRASKT